MKQLKILFTLLLLMVGGSELYGSSYLSPKQAFQVSVKKDDNKIEATINLGEGIHLYHKSLKVKVIKPKKFSIDMIYPQTELFHEKKSYSKKLVLNIPLSQIEETIEGEYVLSIGFQGCSDKNLCYNPMEKTFKFKTQESFLGKIKNLISDANAGNIVETLKSESSFFVLLLFLVLGLLLALTPCIFPMIPILSSILVAQSSVEKPSALKGFFTSLIYVLSMAVTYTLVGVVSGLLGADIQSSMQNPWVLTAFSIMFVALAFSLFGYYQIQLPSRFQSKITSASDEVQGKGILGIVVMGFLSAFIIGPCVAPPLAGAVIFISQTGDAFLGGMALFMMSLGMGFPLLLVGIGAGKWMPKPGGWMDSISKIFGVVMLGLAIFMLSKVVANEITLLLWALLFMGSSLFMGVFSSNSEHKMIQLVGLVSLIYGVSLFIALLSGGDSMLKPFEKFTKVERAVNLKTSVVGVKQGYSISKLEQEVSQSKKPVLVEFSKDSCLACEELEKFTFSDQAVANELKRFNVIKIDITNNTKEDKLLLKKYHLFGTPNIIFFSKKGKFLEKKSLTGFIPSNKFLAYLEEIK